MMTILEALAIIEVAVLECKKRNINTSEVWHALDLLEPCIRPEWVMSQFRFNTLDGFASNETDGEAQEQALRATFPGIRDSVRELLGKRMDALKSIIRMPPYYTRALLMDSALTDGKTITVNWSSYPNRTLGTRGSVYPFL
jgi:hypothetical protein